MTTGEAVLFAVFPFHMLAFFAGRYVFNTGRKVAQAGEALLLRSLLDLVF